MGRSELGPNPITVFFLDLMPRCSSLAMADLSGVRSIARDSVAEEGRKEEGADHFGLLPDALGRLCTVSAIHVDDIIILVDCIISDEPLPFPSSSLSSSPSPSLSTDGDVLDAELVLSKPRSVVVVSWFTRFLLVSSLSLSRFSPKSSMEEAPRMRQFSRAEPRLALHSSRTPPSSTQMRPPVNLHIARTVSDFPIQNLERNSIKSGAELGIQESV